MEEIKLKGLDETIYSDTLNSGLKVYMWVNKKVNTFYGTLSVKYGSLYNRFSVNNKNYSTPPGVAHFLEHVKFYENKDTSAQDYFNKLGSDTNAFTTFNYTNYQVFGGTNPKDNILHLVNFVFNNYFTKNIVRGEKGIIIEEENMGEDNPYTVSLFKLFDNIFHNYEYKKLITGTRNDIKKITLEDIKLVFNNFYHPENMFLVITGNFNPYEIIEALKENDKNMNFKKYSNPVRIVKKEPKKVKTKYEEININVTNRKIKIGIKIPRKNFKNYDDLTLRMYMNLLLKANFGSTSDFGSELLAKELISNLSYMSNIYDNYVLIIFNIDSEYKEEILKKFGDKLANLTIDEKTFNRMKNANIAGLILDFEDVEYVNSLIQTEILYYNKILDNIKEIYENASYEEIIKFKDNLDLKERSVLILNPLQQKNSE